MKIIFNCFVLLSLMIAATSQAADLKPFTSDGCSLFPDGTINQQELWLACCTAHDYAYWQGGTRTQRLQADTALKSCVTDVGLPSLATIMETGVKIGGSPFWPTRFRWGYGWPYPRFYKELSSDELAQVAKYKESL